MNHLPPPEPETRHIFWYEDDDAIDKLSCHDRNKVLREIEAQINPPQGDPASETRVRAKDIIPQQQSMPLPPPQPFVPNWIERRTEEWRATQREKHPRLAWAARKFVGK